MSSKRALFVSCCLVVAALTALSTPLAAQVTPIDLSNATDIDRPEDYSFDQEYCQKALLLTDVIKDVGHGVQLDIIELSAAVVSDAEEQELAPMVRDLINQELIIVEDPELQAYLTGLLETLRPFMDRELEYEVLVFDSGMPNAFAFPGGIIAVSTGLARLVTTEAQMLGVIAHELGHHELRHVIAHVQYLKLLGVWEPDALLNSLTGQAVGTLALPMQSRQERAADVFAVDVTFQLGYSPHQMGQLMLLFDLYYLGQNEVEGNSFAGFLLTETMNLIEDHPRPRLRACTINDEIQLRLDAGGDPKFYVGQRNYTERKTAAETIY